MSKLPENLNQLNKQEFTEAISLLFEQCTLLSELLFSMRPFESYTALLLAASQLIPTLPLESKLEIINAHPRIGAPAATLSSHSKLEQGGANELVQVIEDLKRLNGLYESKFGFMFVVFVNGRPRSEIVRVMEERLNGSNSEDELKSGLDDMILIAHDRLKKMGKE